MLQHVVSHSILFWRGLYFFPQILTIRKCSTFTKCIIMFNFSFLVVMEHIKSLNYLLDYTQLIVCVTSVGRVHRLGLSIGGPGSFFWFGLSFLCLLLPDSWRVFSFCKQTQGISSNIKQIFLYWLGSQYELCIWTKPRPHRWWPEFIS